MANGLFDLSGKVTVVTGGNGGLGLGFARGIAKQGGDLEIWARSEEKNAKAKAELEAFGVRVITRQVDVSNEDAVGVAFESTVKDFGRVDCVIANSGVPPTTNSSFELTAEKWRALLDINLDGAFYTLREGARQMVKRAEAGDPGGSLIFCGSLSMLHGLPGKGNYAAAKGAMGAVIRGMAVEFGKHGIRANTIAPGYIKTEMTGSGDEWSGMDKFFASKTPIQRPGYMKDFEGIAAYLASDASAFHTGDTIVIDGGSVILPAYINL
ncbi:SDR family oxidoreductase [Phenylobacterium sp. LjRoot225]|uniref:SDR family NAD(P)-dependent oxidoreductase n=1 Tax=Phenylobacterium sp. LjRoot225 TaxID=3342285 RepID=UPI003ED14DB7